MNIRTVTDVATEPITLTEAKNHLRVDIDDDDDLINHLITAAREYCEAFTSLSFAEKTLEMTIDEFPKEDYIKIRYSPVKSITSFKYTDEDGNETTLVSGTDYITDLDFIPGKIVLPHDKSWPSDELYPTSPIKIRYVSGYETLPANLKQAMYLIIGHLYENRENTSVVKMHELPLGAQSLLWNNREKAW